ncbi:MAG: hypothetical protein LBJ23_07405 [Tannerella sp.]|jgi:hypothetical protein|nr:hypothetical protein [Tannerella sp.]
MKKIVLISILSLLVGHCIKAQIAVTPDGLMNADDITTREVIIKYPGVQKEKLIDVYRGCVKTYSERGRNLSFFDGEDGLMIKFAGVGRFGTGAVKTGSASFTLLFMFKDESVMIQARDLKLRRIGLFKGEARQYIYTEKGKVSRQGEILKPMVEREINAHFREIVDTAGSLIAIQGK